MTCARIVARGEVGFWCLSFAARCPTTRRVSASCPPLGRGQPSLALSRTLAGHCAILTRPGMHGGCCRHGTRGGSVTTSPPPVPMCDVLRGLWRGDAGFTTLRRGSGAWVMDAGDAGGVWQWLHACVFPRAVLYCVLHRCAMGRVRAACTCAASVARGPHGTPRLSHERWINFVLR